MSRVTVNDMYTDMMQPDVVVATGCVPPVPRPPGCPGSSTRARALRGSQGAASVDPAFSTTACTGPGEADPVIQRSPPRRLNPTICPAATGQLHSGSSRPVPPLDVSSRSKRAATDVRICLRSARPQECVISPVTRQVPHRDPLAGRLTARPSAAYSLRLERPCIPPPVTRQVPHGDPLAGAPDSNRARFVRPTDPNLKLYELKRLWSSAQPCVANDSHMDSGMFASQQ